MRPPGMDEHVVASDYGDEVDVVSHIIGDIVTSSDSSSSSSSSDEDEGTGRVGDGGLRLPQQQQQQRQQQRPGAPKIPFDVRISRDPADLAAATAEAATAVAERMAANRSRLPTVYQLFGIVDPRGRVRCPKNLPAALTDAILSIDPVATVSQAKLEESLGYVAKKKKQKTLKRRRTAIFSDGGSGGGDGRVGIEVREGRGGDGDDESEDEVSASLPPPPPSSVVAATAAAAVSGRVESVGGDDDRKGGCASMVAMESSGYNFKRPVKKISRVFSDKTMVYVYHSRIYTKRAAPAGDAPTS